MQPEIEGYMWICILGAPVFIPYGLAMTLYKFLENGTKALREKAKIISAVLEVLLTSPEIIYL